MKSTVPRRKTNNSVKLKNSKTNVWEVMNDLSLVHPKNSAVSSRICLPLYASKHFLLILSLRLHKRDNPLLNHATESLHEASTLSVCYCKVINCQQEKKKTIIENKQDLEKKHTGLFSPKEILVVI